MISSVAPVARLMAREPDTVMAGPPGCSVCEAIMYSEAEFRLTMDDPIVNACGKAVGVDETVGVACCCGRVEVEEPTTTNVWESLVCRATMAADGPEPTVIVDPGARVCPATIYSDEPSGVIVLPPTTIGRTLFVVGTIGVSYIVEADDPICIMVLESSVDRAMTVVDDSELTVTDDPGTSV